MHPSTNPSKIVRLIFGPGSNGGGGGGSGSSSNQHPRETELDHVEPAKEPVHTRVESRFDACIQPCLVNTMQSGFNLIGTYVHIFFPRYLDVNKKHPTDPSSRMYISLSNSSKKANTSQLLMYVCI